MFAFLNPLVGVAYHVVVALSQFLTPLTGGLATAAAIIVFTLAVRLLLAPLSFTAFRGQARIAALQPRIAELRTKYSRQPERLQRELTALYAAEGGGMLAGCLPLLLQLPFFSVLYRLLESAKVAGQSNVLLAKRLLVAPLGSHLLTGAGLASAQGLVFVGLLVLLAAACFAATRAARTAAPAPAGGRVITGALPYVTVVIAAFAPLAAGLYLLTSTAWTAAERAIWHRRMRPGAQGPTAIPG
jgi:YidC/Oxa1 family membrane protein insertase